MRLRARRRGAPLWFELLIVVALGLALRALAVNALPAPGVQFAFWAFFASLIGWIWEGVQAVGQVSLAVLNYIVLGLQLTVRVLHNTIIGLGIRLSGAFRSAWAFISNLYSDVLVPAWRKFFVWIDRLHDALERVFKPVFDVLRTIRGTFLKWYTEFVRPVLDSLDIARKILRVFASLGLEWARKLDAELARLQERIDAPFQFVLRKINEVINLVNRIVTANGLFQRLILLRSIERDIANVSAAFYNWRRNPLTAADFDELARKNKPPSTRALRDAFIEYSDAGTGPMEPILSRAIAALAELPPP